MSREATIEAKATALHTHILSHAEENLYTNNPWAIITAIEDFANTAGMMTFKKSKIAVAQRALSSMAVPPTTLLEFGTYVGSSAIAWGAILQDLNKTPTPTLDQTSSQEESTNNIKIYTFELSPTTASIARDLIHLAGLSHIVEVLEGPAADSLRALHAEGKVVPGAVDVVFFDHWEKFYLSDLKLCEELRLFRVGSLAIADNVDRPGAPDYLEYVRGGGEGEVKYVTRSVEAEEPEGRPKIVEISTVV